MTIHVDIADADARPSELVAAAKRGEDVVLTEAGLPTARLGRLEGGLAVNDAEIVARRMRTLGMYSHLVGDDDMPLVRDMKPTEAEIEERFARKFGTAD